MADSYVVYTATSNQTVFTVPFPYFEQSDVDVQVDAISMLNPADYTWNTAGSIKMRVGVPLNSTVTIRRSTSPDTRLVAFNNGAVLTADDLNTAAIQAFYRTQELQDQLDTYISGGVSRYSITGANPYLTPQDLLNSAADAALQTTIAQALLSATSDIQTNANDILAQTSRVDTLQAAVDALTSGTLGGVATYLSNETTARIAGDTALQGTFNLMGAVSGSGLTFVLNTANVYVDPTTSMADKFAGILSSIAGNTAAITSEATTRAAADSAASTLISGLTATVNSNNSTLSAAIATEASTRAAADTTQASQITSLTTSVAGNTASISSQLTSINGLQAQYVLKIDVNGNVAGFGLAATGSGTSNFTIVANSFSLIDPGHGATSPIVPFTVSGGVVYMQNVVIGGALIQDATINGAKLMNATIGQAQLGSACIGSAQIQSAAIQSANIANAQITNAHIANLAVDTNQIVNNAVTKDGTYSQSGTYTHATVSTGAQTYTPYSVTYASDGGRLLIFIQGSASAGNLASGPTTCTFTFGLQINGTYVYSQSGSFTSPANGPGTGIGFTLQDWFVCQPLAGNLTCSFVAQIGSGWVGSSPETFTASGCRLVIIELLK